MTSLGTREMSSAVAWACGPNQLVSILALLLFVTVTTAVSSTPRLALFAGPLSSLPVLTYMPTGTTWQTA